MRLFLYIALKYLLARKRQSLVSLSGIIIGVAFFLAISSLMQGSQKDFIKRLVDNAPHITVSDEYRNPRRQPLDIRYPDALVELHNVKPLSETRGLRGYRQTLADLQRQNGVRASAVLAGQAILTFAGRDTSLTLNGMKPEEMRDLTTIEEDMVEGSIENLVANRNGIIVGQELMRKLSLDMGDNITLASPAGQLRTFKIIGKFHTGQASYDETQAFVDIKRAQALLNRPNRANRLIIKLNEPENARAFAEGLERRIGYKSVSWQEASEDIMSTLAIRNIIMYSVVSAVLLVASFGIYNIIFTVIMEKQRDISIMKSMGFQAGDIRWIFLIQGAFLGIAGVAAGLPLGCMLMLGLQQIRFKPPGLTEPIQMPIDWTAPQFFVAAAFAFTAAILASYFPARKGARVMPVDVLRGAM